MGHRRHRAFEVNKEETIPSIIKDGLSETDALALNLIENLERKDLTLMQEARALQRFIERGLTQDEISRRINKSKTWLQIRFTALKLPEIIQREIDAGYVTQAQIKEIASIPGEMSKLEYVRQIKEAKERGDKRQILLKPNKVKVSTGKKVRTITEIFRMQDFITDNIGCNIGTRCLAWAAGEISGTELINDVRIAAEEEGKFVTIPKEFQP